MASRVGNLACDGSKSIAKSLMSIIPFALYDAFTDVAFGGSQAAVVSDAAGIDPTARFRLAKEIGMPATGFVDACNDSEIEAQFFSTIMELPMCGHGTMCLMTRMAELGILKVAGGKPTTVNLKLPTGTAVVQLSRRADGRPTVLLDITPPTFSSPALDVSRLSKLLGADKDIYDVGLPMEIASGDFIHLVVPIAGLEAMCRINPDFSGLAQFCRDNGLETVAAFCTDVEREHSNIHVRDFCPAVGVAESAAAGTTNAALTSYLMRHELVREISEGTITVQAEQGMEIGRPSTIQSIVSMNGGTISRLQVGGVATKVMDGHLHLPN